MKKIYPQSKAIAIGKWGCLALCYLYCLGIETEDEGRMLDYVSRAMDKGLLDDTCTVLDAQKFLFHFSGRKFNVEKKAISDIKEITDPAPVRFDYGANSHWVVVANGEIVFNSLESSVCVAKGKPVTARVMSKI